MVHSRKKGWFSSLKDGKCPILPTTRMLSIQRHKETGRWPEPRGYTIQCLLGPKQRLFPPASKELWGRKTRVLGHGSSRTIHFLDPCQKLPWLRPKKGPISLVSSGLFGKSTISELPKLITDLVHTARSALRCTCTETALTMYTATLTERARSKSWRNLSLVALSTYAST